jgi:hypothetical protein
MNPKDSMFGSIEPMSALENKYILEYLSSRDYCFRDLQELTREDAQRLLREACFFASLKLAEVESRAQFLRKIEIAK